jgi:hypothetical protein
MLKRTTRDQYGGFAQKVTNGRRVLGTEHIKEMLVLFVLVEKLHRKIPSPLDSR